MARTATPDPVQVDREVLKVRLVELGVEFANNAQTKTLQSLLEKAEADAVKTEEPPAATTGSEEPLQDLGGGDPEPQPSAEPAASSEGIVAAPAVIEGVDNPAAAQPTTKPEAAPVAPEIIVGTDKGQVLIANQHTGLIVMPRKGPGGIVLPPFQLPPGQVTPMDADLWAHFKTMKMIQVYLDHKLLAEVDRAGTVLVTSQTSEPVVPEHLQTEAEAGQFGEASLRSAKSAEITIK